MEKLSTIFLECIKKINPYVVRIETPDGWGTGFFVARGRTLKENVVCNT